MPLHAVGRILQANRVADTIELAVVFLCSPALLFVSSNGLIRFL